MPAHFPIPPSYSGTDNSRLSSVSTSTLSIPAFQATAAAQHQQCRGVSPAALCLLMLAPWSKKDEYRRKTAATSSYMKQRAPPESALCSILLRTGRDEHLDHANNAKAATLINNSPVFLLFFCTRKAPNLTIHIRVDKKALA